MKRILTQLAMFAPILFLPLLHAQSTLPVDKVAAADAIGKKTDIPLTLGTLIPAQKGKGIQAFITLPLERIAYAASDMASDSHGSGTKDPLAGELRLNRLRVTGLPFPNTGEGQRHSREVTICNVKHLNCIRPAHQVIDVNEVVAEFEMPAVEKIAEGSGNFLVRIKNNIGAWEPDIEVGLNSLHKKGL